MDVSADRKLKEGLLDGPYVFSQIKGKIIC